MRGWTGRNAKWKEPRCQHQSARIELALAAAQAAADKKAEDIVLLDVADQLVITDIFVVASAPNERQVIAIVDAIEEALLALPEKAKPVRREGERAGRWVLLDYVDIVVHVQHTEEREFYALDRLWKDCERIPFVDRDLADPARPTRRHGVTRFCSGGTARPSGTRPDRIQGHADVALDDGRPGSGSPPRRASRPSDPDVIVSSDLRRAADTAAALAAVTGLPVHPDPGCANGHFGTWQGMTGGRGRDRLSRRRTRRWRAR